MIRTLLEGFVLVILLGFAVALWIVLLDWIDWIERVAG